MHDSQDLFVVAFASPQQLYNVRWIFEVVFGGLVARAVASGFGSIPDGARRSPVEGA